jgi:plasmid stability protein
MPTLTIRNLPPDVVERMKRHAKENGRSMEQEARDALSERFTSRNAILDRIEARWETIPRLSAAEVREGLAIARKGRASVNAAVQEAIKAHKKRRGGKP